jgi:hypothetical protein
MKIQDYRDTLRSLPSLSNEAGQAAWRDYLTEHSGLPGPRGNLELAQAVALEGNETMFAGYLTDFTPQVAPVNSPQEFLYFCGVLGLGRMVAEGKRDYLQQLRHCASDPRWRTREGVAMALQNWADPPLASTHNPNLPALLDEMEQWSRGNYFEQRAAMAALCEPRLLIEPAVARRVFALLDSITAELASASNRRDDGFQALRKALGYGWSVAVAAYPNEGKTAMEAWLNSKDKDVRWLMKQNLKKNRLVHMDADWVRQCAASLEE